jgi:hypothetical protein
LARHNRHAQTPPRNCLPSPEPCPGWQTVVRGRDKVGFRTPAPLGPVPVPVEHHEMTVLWSDRVGRCSYIVFLCLGLRLHSHGMACLARSRCLYVSDCRPPKVLPKPGRLIGWHRIWAPDSVQAGVTHAVRFPPIWRKMTPIGRIISYILSCDCRLGSMDIAYGLARA